MPYNSGNMDEEPRLIGVPPHPKPWPLDDRLDPELLAQGDRRNVADKYRYWKVEAIRADLGLVAHPLHVAIENWQHDSNIGTIVRTANAFNVECVHIIGRKQWNRRGAMVTDRYLSIRHHASVEAFLKDVHGRAVIAVDNVVEAQPLGDTALPERAVLVFGGEGPGISQEMLAASTKTVMIEQFGSTRSLNVGVAAGIVMYHWMQQHVLA